ncbi:pentapeptide repeat-containing protein [Natronococcus wangiae]|uniref:pentapeptide repeat-containing protein n=1 Tax=Natronococcus wangiae TaxID=3068275 RepID=UPI00273ECCE2|nr:pentapeptide repeat-containing protein [Natronococcus sp. AD5]
MPEDRCGYTARLSGIENVGAVCCWRPTWDETDRCIWHTAETVPPAAYRRTAPNLGERLDGADLRGAVLAETGYLAGCSLIGADFTDAVLDHADLSGTDLRRASFRDVDAREASFAGANLHDSVFVFVDLRGANFEDAMLYRAGLTDVRINLQTTFGEMAVYENDLDRDASDGATTEMADSAKWVYRELQRVYDENAFPERVQQNFLREMDLRRRQAWQTGNYLQALKLAGSRWIMRYGTSPWRVVLTSLATILVCALLYPITGGIREVRGEETITYQIANPTEASGRVLISAFFRSLYFSVVTFGTLGYGDIQPVGGWARVIASVESLLGIMLMALLVFVLTRSVQH